MDNKNLNSFQEVEQIHQLLVDTIPPFLHNTYQGLLVEGFSIDQAFTLTRDILRHTLCSQSSSDKQ